MRFTLGVPLLCVIQGLILGCLDGRPQPAHVRADIDIKKVIVNIERGDYTIMHPRPHITVAAEMLRLFEIKEAYPWLIDALDSRDPVVQETAEYGFAASGVPGPINSASLRVWYSSTPTSEWVYDGVLWEPPSRKASSKSLSSPLKKAS